MSSTSDRVIANLLDQVDSLKAENAQLRAKLAPICVTGGSGFLGSWCVKLLLDRGHIVHATTRSAAKAEFLRRLPGAAERLRIFAGCDLMVDGSFDAAIEGCDAVLHTASPFFMQGGSRDNLVEPAIRGTANVLEACRKFGVTRVTLTASTACVYVNYGRVEGGAEHVYTDADWSPEELLEEKKNWYCLSKVKAEKLAWDISRRPGCPFKLCVLNPCLIWGPQLEGQNHLNTSCAALVPMLDGSAAKIDNACKAIVDVRDVALAHIRPLELDAGWGKRFLLVGACPHYKECAAVVRSTLADRLGRADLAAKVPTEVSDKLGPTVMGAPPPNPVLYDASPSERVLGIKYYSMEEMTQTSVESMLANGFTSKSQYIPGK